MKSIIVGTAGHIDHGKTALVRALTGVDADRLPEEKRRGITIDIGFADLDLGEVRIGFVDVPGHERFVKNMLAGAHGIDVVALVIAADESVMPQTREHFDICRLLGVNNGLIVLTKKDLVDDDLLALARAEAEELVKGSFLEGAPVISVSSRTGEGIEEAKSALRKIGLEVPDRSSSFIARLPIDRSFSMKGFGAVVTGTLIAGEIHESDELDLLPMKQRIRVRGVQVHGASVKRGVAGQRTAINLGGVDSKTIERGMVLAGKDWLRPTQVVDASINVLEESPRALRSRHRVRVHIGATEALARVRVLESNGEIQPGARGLAQLRLEAPTTAVLGDRFILRAYSPQITIGGGVILDPFAARHRSKEMAATRAALIVLAEGNPAEQIAQFVASSGRLGMTTRELKARTAWRDEVIEDALKKALANKSILRLETTAIGLEVYDDLKRAIVREIEGHHKREPLARGLPRESLRERFFAGASPEMFRDVMTQFERDGAFVSDKEIVRSREHSRELSSEDTQAKEKLEAAFQKAGVAPPSLSDAFSAAGLDTSRGRKILQLLTDSGALVKVHGDMLFHRGALDELTKKLRGYASKTSDHSIDVGSFKELAGISRKYAIPLLEHFDRQRVTRREGDRRIIL